VPVDGSLLVEMRVGSEGVAGQEGAELLPRPLLRRRTMALSWLGRFSLASPPGTARRWIDRFRRAGGSQDEPGPLILRLADGESSKTVLAPAGPPTSSDKRIAIPRPSRRFASALESPAGDAGPVVWLVDLSELPPAHRGTATAGRRLGRRNRST
jgi:hypothetical protein